MALVALLLCGQGIRTHNYALLGLTQHGAFSFFVASATLFWPLEGSLTRRLRCHRTQWAKSLYARRSPVGAAINSIWPSAPLCYQWPGMPRPAPIIPSSIKLVKQSRLSRNFLYSLSLVCFAEYILA